MGADRSRGDAPEAIVPPPNKQRPQANRRRGRAPPFFSDPRSAAMTDTNDPSKWSWDATGERSDCDSCYHGGVVGKGAIMASVDLEARVATLEQEVARLRAKVDQEAPR